MTCMSTVKFQGNCKRYFDAVCDDVGVLRVVPAETAGDIDNMFDQEDSERLMIFDTIRTLITPLLLFPYIRF